MNEKGLTPGDIVALLGVYEGKRYLVYGEVTRFEAHKEIIIAQTMIETEQGKTERKERKIDLTKWTIQGIMVFASWDSAKLFELTKSEDV